MTKLAKLAIEKSKITIFISVIIIIFGIIGYIYIPKQAMPDLIPPMASIQVLAPGYTPDDVEKYVTKPIEDAILAVDGVDSIESITISNLAIFNIMLDINESETQAIFDEIMSSINSLSLPDNVQDPIFKSAVIAPHAVYSISSDELSLLELENEVLLYAEDLKNVNNVAQVNVIGGSDQQVYVNLDLSALETNGLTVSTVSNVIYFSSLEIPIGTLKTSEGSSSIEIPANYTSIEELENIVIGMNGMIPITLKDISTIVLMENPGASIYSSNDEDAIFVEVFFKSAIDFTVLGDELIDTENSF